MLCSSGHLTLHPTLMVPPCDLLNTFNTNLLGLNSFTNVTVLDIFYQSDQKWFFFLPICPTWLLPMCPRWDCLNFFTNMSAPRKRKKIGSFRAPSFPLPFHFPLYVSTRAPSLLFSDFLFSLLLLRSIPDFHIVSVIRWLRFRHRPTDTLAWLLSSSTRAHSVQ